MSPQTVDLIITIAAGACGLLQAVALAVLGYIVKRINDIDARLDDVVERVVRTETRLEVRGPAPLPAEPRPAI